MTELEARRFAEDCMRLGVPAAWPVENGDGTWCVKMTA